MVEIDGCPLRRAEKTNFACAHADMATAVSTCPPLMYPEKFELALQYGEKVLLEKPELSDSDKILLALSKREKAHARSGKHKEERPSMWDTVARAKWNAWLELGNRSKMEAMFMYVTAVEEVRSTRLALFYFFTSRRRLTLSCLASQFAPNWWAWPPLGLVEADDEESDAVVVDAADAMPPSAAPAATAPAAVVPALAAEPAAAPPMSLTPNALAVGGWSSLSDVDAPARYRHATAVVGARLFVFGGRSNSGRLAPDLHQLNLLTGRWSIPPTGGNPPDLRWGHSMNAYRQWLVIFGGHRRRGCLNDTVLFDTEAMSWRRRMWRGCCRRRAATARPPSSPTSCGSLAATPTLAACSSTRCGRCRSPRAERA